jgi:hypothetical protein
MLKLGASFFGKVPSSRYFARKNTVRMTGIQKFKELYQKKKKEEQAANKDESECLMVFILSRRYSW